MKFSRSFTMSDQVVGVAPRSVSPVRRGYVVAAVLALVMMVLAIQYGSDWLLNFLHVMTGALWTGIDLFMGFVVGPVLKRLPLDTRRAVISGLVPRTLFLMPTVSIITSTTGWFLAKRMGFLDVCPFPIIPMNEALSGAHVWVVSITPRLKFSGLTLG